MTATAGKSAGEAKETVMEEGGECVAARRHGPLLYSFIFQSSVLLLAHVCFRILRKKRLGWSVLDKRKRTVREGMCVCMYLKPMKCAGVLR